MDYLPDHLLINIFDYFNGYTLQDVSKVCQRWCILVKTTQKLVRKFRLYCDPSEVIKLEAQMQKFPYANLCLDLRILKPDEKEKYLNTVENYFERIEKIKFLNANSFLMLDTLSKISSTLLELRIDLSHDYQDDFQLVELKKLINLSVIGSLNILKFLKTDNLKILELKTCGSCDEYLKDFLLTCPKIEVIQISRQIPQPLLTPAEYPFKLNVIAMEEIRAIIPTSFIKSFLLPQKDHLKQLLLNLIRSDLSEILLFAIKNLKLEVLRCRGVINLLNTAVFMEENLTNSTIKKLDLKLDVIPVQKNISHPVLSVIRSCPQIEQLTVLNKLYEHFDEFMLEIQERNLRTLGIALPLSTSKISIHRLEVLTVHFLGSLEYMSNFMEFTVNFPNVRKIIIHSILTHIPNLLIYFQKISYLCQKLEEIQISNFIDPRNIGQIPRLERGRQIVLHFQMQNVKAVREMELLFRKSPQFIIKFYSKSDQDPWYCLPQYD